MDKYFKLLILFGLFYWGCGEDQPEEQDTTPPTISISSHSSGQSVYEIVTIAVSTGDNDGVRNVTFFIDDSLVLDDSASPYQYEWNTLNYPENSEHIVRAISYDNSNNSTESQPIMLVVKNELGKPSQIEINSINADGEDLSITWSISNDNDFYSYQLEKSIEPEMTDFTVIFVSEVKSDTLYLDNEVESAVTYYYRINVTDSLGLQTKSEIKSGVLESFINIWGELYPVSTTTSLYLSNNNLSGPIPPEIGNLTNLTHLDLSNNQLTDSIPHEIGNLINLNQLLLNNNELSGSIPSELSNLVDLQILFLLENQLTGDLPLELMDLTNLMVLAVGWNQLTGSIPENINNLTNLVELQLNSNQFSGTIPNSICDIFPNLEFYLFDNNLFCPPYPSCIEDVVGSQNIVCCNPETEVELWGQCYNIETTTELVLVDVELSGGIPPEIGDLINLTRLEFLYNGLSGEIPPEIGSLINLGYLRISGNPEISGSIPSTIGNLSNLNSLHLSDSQLSGSIPSEIGNLSNLSNIRLYSNQLSGEIPPEIGNLSNLCCLFLNYNQLSGEIPSEIGNLNNLGELFLSDNALSGLVPESICNLNLGFNLGEINLSNNQLCPPYPSCTENIMGEQDTSNCD